MRHILLLAIALFGFAPAGLRAASDVQWTFGSVGASDYLLTAVSSPETYSGSLPANDPTMVLRVGTRYAATVTNFGIHPLQILAKGPDPGQDVVLLSQGSTSGSLEGDVGVNWIDSGAGTVEFTVTQSLLDAMNQGGRAPGYRCELHFSMRGDFQVLSSDAEWTFDNAGASDYLLVSVSDPALFGGGLPANDPTINLQVGQRYGVSVVNFGLHPLQLLAKGASSGTDVVLLSQGATVGGFEADPGVNWLDSGTGRVEFTLTQALADAMVQQGLGPGYRCGVHVSTMRGDFAIAPSASVADWGVLE